MKKINLFIVVFVLIFLVFCGCFQSEKKSKSEKLIGTWVSQDSFYKQYTFKENGECLINDYKLEGTYYVNNKGQLVINQTSPFVSTVYDFKFNYNNDKLTLTDVESGVPEIFEKK